jgi:uncharacterized membrane protein YhaH (DUF805 family)
MGSRVGAGTYLLSMSLAVNAWCLAMIGLYYHVIVPDVMRRDYVTYVIWVLGALVGVLFFYLSRRRLQDLNCPGGWARVLAFPFFGVMFLPVLCFLSGPRFTNSFGKPPEPSGALKVMAALVSFAVALVLVPFVTTLYAPLHFQSAF